MSYRLRIYLLGGFRVEQDGVEIPRFRTKKTASLLAYLACHNRFPTSREVLIEQFWPNDSVEKARNSLNTAISTLRRQFGETPALSEPILWSERHTVKLNGAQVWTDVDAFRRCASIALRPGPGRTSALEEALGLYEGNLLEGFYDEWILTEALELEGLYENLRMLQLPPEPLGKLQPQSPVNTVGTNLPRIANPFVGRESELQRLEELHAQFPLVSIVGFGGIGKTRIAIELGKRIVAKGEEVWLISYAGAPSTISLADEILRQLGGPANGLADPLDQLCSRFQGTSATLILDNLEHLSTASEDLPEIIERLRSVKFIATTRVTLNISDESVFALEPLAIPGADEDLDALRQNPSAALFVSRSASAAPGFTLNSQNADSVRNLCRSLAGNSLMIELAAAKVQVYSVKEMLSQMERPLEFLVTRVKDRSERHRSVRATIEWSYRILSSRAQSILPKLALANGGWTASSASRVLQEGGIAEVIQELIDGSFLQYSLEPESRRFTMHPVLREFGLTLLDQQDETQLQQQRLSYYEQAVSAVVDIKPGQAQKVWLDWAADELENIRDCLQWGFEHLSEVEAASLAVGLRIFWERRGRFREGLSWLQKAIEIEGLPLALEAKILCAAGRLSCIDSDWASAERYWTSAADAFSRLGDSMGHSEAWAGLGVLRIVDRDYEKAEIYLAESLRELEEAGIPAKAEVLLDYAQAATGLGNFEGAVARCDRAISAARQEGDPFKVGRASLLRAEFAILTGANAEAETILQEWLTKYSELHDPLGVALTLTALSKVHYRMGRLQTALDETQMALRSSEEMGDVRLFAHLQAHQAKILLEQGDERTAEPLLREATSTLTKLRDPGVGAHAATLLALIVYRRDPMEACCLLNDAIKGLDRDPLCNELYDAYLAIAEMGRYYGLSQDLGVFAGAARGFYTSKGQIPEPFVIRMLDRCHEQTPDRSIPDDPLSVVREALGALEERFTHLPINPPTPVAGCGYKTGEPSRRNRDRF